MTPQDKNSVTVFSERSPPQILLQQFAQFEILAAAPSDTVRSFWTSKQLNPSHLILNIMTQLLMSIRRPRYKQFPWDYFLPEYACQLSISEGKNVHIEVCGLATVSLYFLFNFSNRNFFDR